ncbi:MAG: heme-binding protein [Amaricoccus sp.]
MDPVVTRQSLSLAAARALVDAAIAHAEAKGLRISAAVADREGAPMALARMDGVPAPIAEFALEKAYTAAVTGASTRDFFAHIDANPSLRMGMTGRPRFLLWVGGEPARHEGEVVGAIGVSGASEDDDLACARAALAACGL